MSGLIFSLECIRIVNRNAYQGGQRFGADYYDSNENKIVTR